MFTLLDESATVVESVGHIGLDSPLRLDSSQHRGTGGAVREQVRAPESGLILASLQ